MATKFSETLLAVRYREVTPAGNFVGGAMYFIKNGLGENGNGSAACSPFLQQSPVSGTGNAVQTNAISGVLWGTFGVPTWITALILFLLIASVLLGGLRRIGSVAGKIVPFMAILYTLASLLIIILNIKEVPAMFLHVIEEAFTPTAAQGVRRGHGHDGRPVRYGAGHLRQRSRARQRAHRPRHRDLHPDQARPPSECSTCSSPP